MIYREPGQIDTLLDIIIKSMYWSDILDIIPLPYRV